MKENIRTKLTHTILAAIMRGTIEVMDPQKIGSHRIRYPTHVEMLNDPAEFYARPWKKQLYILPGDTFERSLGEWKFVLHEELRKTDANPHILCELSEFEQNYDKMYPYFRSEDIKKSPLLKMTPDVIFVPTETRTIVASGHPAPPINIIEQVGERTTIQLISPIIICPREIDPESAACEELEELINNPEVKEKELQGFFERHPTFLEMGSYDKMIAQPILSKEYGESLVPDFVLHPIGEELWDIAEIKLPVKSIVVKKKNRIHFSANVTELVAQLNKYRDYFESPAYRQKVMQKYKFRAYRPKLIGIIGRSIDVDPIARRDLDSQVPQYIRILSFKDIIRKAKQRPR